MPSPPRPPRGSPPRRALHERTDSQTNERSLRMIGDPLAPVYGSPFPTKPSQILSPKGFSGQRSTVEAELEPAVSHGRHSPRKSQQYIEPYSENPILRDHDHDSDSDPSDERSSKRQSTTNTSFYTPQTSIPARSAGNKFLAMNQPVEEEGRISDDIVQLPSVPLRQSPSSSLPPDPSITLEGQEVQAKDSESSLSSVNSTGTVVVKRVRDGKKRASYSAFPNVVRPSSSKSSLSLSTPQKSATKESITRHEPIPLIAPGSPTSPLAGDVDRRTSSAPMYANLQTASASSVNLQYPIIRPPSASASWVEPPSSSHERSQQAADRTRDRWNPHLSTVQSEGAGSQSEDRSSQTMWLPDSSHVSKSSSMALTGRASSDRPAIPSPPTSAKSPNVPSLPSPPLVQKRDFTGSTIRVVNEEEDTISKLQPIPGSRGSEHLALPAPSADVRNSVVTRPSSRASFFRDSIPAWAKAYYARPHSSSSMLKAAGRNDRPSTSTDNISLNIFRPRTRNNPEERGQSRRDSLAINPVRPRELDLAEIRGPPRRMISSNWSPHLWHDRTSLGRRRTIFQAPKVDGLSEGKAPSKRNAQIVLFVIGFIFPVSWFIASFLPLPTRPASSSVKGKNNPGRTQVITDLEKQLDPIDEARYENARWWRNINRILSLVGIVIVVAVITIAAVTAK